MRLLRALSASISAFLVTLPSYAATFSQICPAAGAGPFALDMNSASTSWQKHMGTATLGNNLWYMNRVIGNNWVNGMAFHAASFNMESTWDFVSFLDDNGQQKKTGLYWGFTVNTVNSDGSGAILVTTDGSNPSPGFNLDTVSATCRTGGFVPTLDRSIDNYFTNHIVLNGTNDTVFLKPSVPTMPYVGYRSMAVTMWRPDNNVDFDIYARCGARPTGTSYTIRAALGGAQEFLDLPESLCASGDWYFAVHSYSGAGTAKLMWNWTTKRNVPLQVGMFGAFTAAEKATVASMLADAQRRVFGMTQGAIQIPTVHLYPGIPTFTGPPPYLVFGDCERSAYYPSSGIINMCRQNWGSAEVLAHEIGHAMLGLPDEYIDIEDNPVSQPRCGHSIMAQLFPSWNDLCQFKDHGKDYVLGVPPMSGPSMWSLGMSNGSLHGFSGREASPDGYPFVIAAGPYHPFDLKFSVTQL